MPIGEMAVRLQDVFMLLGLPQDGRAVAARPIGLHWRQEILDRFAGVIEAADDEPAQMQFIEKHGPTKAWLLQFRLEHLADDAEDWRVSKHLEAYLLWLFG